MLLKLIICLKLRTVFNLDSNYFSSLYRVIHHCRSECQQNKWHQWFLAENLWWEHSDIQDSLWGWPGNLYMITFTFMLGSWEDYSGCNMWLKDSCDLSVMVVALYSSHLWNLCFPEVRVDAGKQRCGLPQYNDLKLIRRYLSNIPEHGANTPEESRLLLSWFVLVV